MRNSLAALLAVGLAGLQFLAVLAVVFSSYLTSQRVLMDHARTLLSDVGNNTAEHSSRFLNPAQGAAELAARLAQHEVLASDNPAQLEQFLFQQLRITPQFSGLYFGGEDGSFVYVMRTDAPAPFRSKLITFEDGARSVDFVWRTEDFQPVERARDPGDRFDPRSRPWYRRASAAMATIWTEPYIFFSSQQPGITLAAPVPDGNGGIRGVVGVDIEISNISNFLARLQIGTHGRALIINSNGDVIAHPDPSLIKTRDSDGTLRFVSIDEFGDPIARAAFANLVGSVAFPIQNELFSEFSHDGDAYIANVLPAISEQMPWTIAVYAPQNDFIGELRRNRAFNIWIAALVAAITGIVGLALALYIYRPVREFAVRSALISQGEVDAAEPLPRTYKELALANESLMQQIVARKKAEREYGQTFDLSPRAMAQISPATGRFLKVNAAFCDLTGHDADRLLQMRFADLTVQGDPPMFTPQAFADDDVFTADREARIRRRDGEIVCIRVNAILIRDHRGTPLHAVVTMDDLTEARARENEIVRLNRDLSHLARGNTMGQMAAGLAHELNQPLTTIAQNADTGLLIVDKAGNSAPELREVLTEIEQQSLRAGEIIRALRGFIGKDESRVTAFDLAELLEQARRLVQAEAVEANVTVVAALPDLPPVRAHRVQIAQVLVNLLRNAIEAMADAESKLRRVTVAAQRRGDMVEVTVEDTGPGVDPSVSLFSQFETTKATGMGLGLSICRSMIEANGGSLMLDRNHQPGARFRFTLRVDGTGTDAV
ncbi:PAS domain S-box protein [Paracoccus stylophorae]|uniref:histidine kinase n=1 Tax=Paracoccus stylophorae TaxID=659350 RepID=A0ABY7SUC1_9RHOB|nr:cache domain-containing protein [Paracoccus stylophorae]WCR10636.1 PAS domain S-box protein [Paracoccus stylophorae]